MAATGGSLMCCGRHVACTSIPGLLRCKRSSLQSFFLATHMHRCMRQCVASKMSISAMAAPSSPEQDKLQEKEHVNGLNQEEHDGHVKKFVWKSHWYPVSLIEDLDARSPTSIQLLGIELVLWHDLDGNWKAFLDKCPHRLAPLSEGRIDESGFLQCSYHGWSFKPDGSCACIPQAAGEGPEAKAVSSSRACVVTFPTLVSQGMLFVWPDAKGWQKAYETEPPKLPAAFDDPNFSTVTIQRDLFYGYDTLMENVSDPSHIDFAHHKVTGKRDRAKPLPFKIESSGEWGYMGANSDTPKITAQFLAPCFAINKIEIPIKLPILGEKTWEVWICSFNVPLAPGKTRSIVCSARNFFRFLMPGPAWWQMVPRWHEHWTSNKVYDGDMIVLQGQEKIMYASTSDATEINKHYGKLTFTPTQADRLVLAFRNWLRRHGNGQPDWAHGSNCWPLPSTALSRKQVKFDPEYEISCVECHAKHGVISHERIQTKKAGLIACMCVYMQSIEREKHMHI